MRICHSVYLSLVFFSLCSPISAQDLPDSTWINWRLVGPQTDFPEPSLTIYPAYYGAVGDGMADDTEAILQALEACGGSPCNVILGEGTFRINSSLSLSSHQHIVGKGSEKTLLLFEMGNNPAACIQMIGENGPAYDVPTYTPKKSHLIHFPEMIEIEEGDYLEFFEPNQSWDSSPADWAAESVGQILQVREVLADGRIETVEDLRFSLDPEHATKVRRIFPVQNAGLHCVSMRRVDVISSGIGAGIHMKFAVESVIEGVESSQSMGSHILVEASAHNVIKGNHIHHAFDYSGSATYGYGITLLHHSSDNLVEDNVLHNLRHALMVKQGANGNVFANNYSYEPYRDELPHDLTGDISLHGHYPFANLFEGNIVQNIIIDHYWGPSGPLNTFFRNVAQDYGIITSNFSMEDVQTSDQVFIGNVVSSKEFLKGLFLLGGENWTYANRVSLQNFSSKDGGLDTLSYFVEEPTCWVSDLTWPGIDPQMDIPELANPAWIRVQKEDIFTKCGCEQEQEETDITTSVEENLPSGVRAYLSSSQGSPILYINSEFSSHIQVQVYSALGQLLLEDVYPLRTGENKIGLPQLGSYPTGVYYLTLQKGRERRMLKWVKN